MPMKVKHYYAKCISQLPGTACNYIFITFISGCIIIIIFCVKYSPIINLCIFCGQSFSLCFFGTQNLGVAHCDYKNQISRHDESNMKSPIMLHVCTYSIVVQQWHTVGLLLAGQQLFAGTSTLQGTDQDSQSTATWAESKLGPLHMAQLYRMLGCLYTSSSCLQLLHLLCFLEPVRNKDVH